MAESAHPIRLFIDCDPGIDDAIALGYAVCQDDVDIIGVAASAGNVPVEQVTSNALGWLALAGRTDIPVHPGAAKPLAHIVPLAHTTPPAQEPEFADDTHGPTGAGYAVLPHGSQVRNELSSLEPNNTDRDSARLNSPGLDSPDLNSVKINSAKLSMAGTKHAARRQDVAAPSSINAAQAWVNAACAHPGEVVGVVLGPATNLALALDLEPELPRLLKRIFIMGGAFNYRGNTRPTTEWNVTWDPEALAQVLAAFGTADHLPVIGPIEATEAVVMTPQRLARMTPSSASPLLPAGAQASFTSPASSDHEDSSNGAQLRSNARSSPATNWGEWLVQIGEALRFYFEFHESDGHGYLAQIHDPYVLAAAIGWARQASKLADSRAPNTESASTESSDTGFLDTDFFDTDPVSAASAATAIASGTPGTSAVGTPEKTAPAGAGPVPWAETAEAAIDVELTGTLTRGETVADWLGRWGRPPNTELIRRLDAESFLDHLETTLMRGPTHDTP